MPGPQPGSAFRHPTNQAGTYIATYRGRRIPNEEAERREARGSRYMFEINTRWTIDGKPRWNVARYVNHSCPPNARPVSRNGGIVIVADRRIEPDEEITYSYGEEYLQYFVENGGCHCAACIRKRRLRRRRARKLRQQSTPPAPQTDFAQAAQAAEVNPAIAVWLNRAFKTMKADIAHPPAAACRRAKSVSISAT